MPNYTNEISRPKFGAWRILFRQFKNPLLLVFIISTVVAFLVGEKSEALVIWIVMTVSILLGFWNEYQAEKVVNDLIKRIAFSVEVIRQGEKIVIPVSEVKINDEVYLRAGSIVPADIKIESLQNLEVNESVLTGESFPQFKRTGDEIYMGTVITGGSARGSVVRIGMDTKYGKISRLVASTRPETEFQKGLRNFSTLLARVAAITVFLVIFFGWLLNHPIVETVLFSLTVAMGITPELLPLIVTLSLSYGAKKLAKKEVIVKQFVSIEDLGNMEILCTDKTGTLTEGKIALEGFYDTNGKTDPAILEFAIVCNSGFNEKLFPIDTIDKSIMDYAQAKKFKLQKTYKKLYDLPFNFENRFMTSVVSVGGETMLISKGSPEAIIARASGTAAEKSDFEEYSSGLQRKGYRVIAVGVKKLNKFDPKLIKSEFKDWRVRGFLVFSDITKKDLRGVLESFLKLGVNIKIVTGDSEIVAEKVAKDAGFSVHEILLGSQIEKMNDHGLEEVAPNVDIFAKVTPSQKIRIIEALKKGGKTVGYIGDGVNDGPALHMADVGISVNTAVDIAKDSASIVLLRKNLGVVADGIKLGRITFQNTIKFILMGTSSDFGNMVSAAAASLVLPFLPMAPVQFLLNDILYDVSQTTIPTDNVDPDLILKPKSWDIDYIKKFMLIFGSIGTVYDFLTFAIMYFVFNARGALFQTGWFVTSFVTEVLVVFVIRTRKIPFFRSLPSIPFLITCVIVILIALILPFSPLASYFDFKPLPGIYFVFLLGLSATYLFIVEVGKFFLNKERFE